MTTTATPFLMFQGGVGREAVEFYVSLFDDGEILDLESYPAGDARPRGHHHARPLPHRGPEISGLRQLRGPRLWLHAVTFGVDRG